MNHEPSNHAILSDKDLLVEGCSSLFAYCTQALHLSEHAAYGRIEAARAARRFPIILELLADGSLHVTAVALLGPHLTLGNHHDVLAAARHKSKRQVEEIVAALRPRPAVVASIRKMSPTVAIPLKPAPTAAAAMETTAASGLFTSTGAAAPPAARPSPESGRSSTSPGVSCGQSPEVERKRRATVQPLAPALYKVQFTASRATCDKLREAQDLLRHQLADGDVAVIIDRALTLLLAELHKRRQGAARHPREAPGREPHGRHIPAAVRREVWQRDSGQCAFVGTSGRCTERGFIEYHHVVPFADGGATVADNLELRCRAHNAFEAERWFGVAEERLIREADRYR